MKSSNMGLYAIAAAIAFVGALWAGVPLAALAPALIFLACPLMMIFMMKGMHGGSDSEPRASDEPRDQHLHH
jgi:hypothetical protein